MVGASVIRPSGRATPWRSAWWDGLRSVLRALGLAAISEQDGPTLKEEARASAGGAGTAEPDPFQAFFWRFERRLFGYLWHLTGDEQAARDLSQEAFVRAWQRFDAIESHRDSGAWLFRVASNLAMTHLRRRSAPVGAAAPLAEAQPMAGYAGDPGGTLAERDVVRRVLAALTPRQRAVLVLHEVCGYSGPEVADVLGISHAAAKMALWRAREGFRAAYLREDKGEDEEAGR